MTSDKALRTARILAFNWEHDDESLSVLADRIRDAIVKACAEQREIDAKIALANPSSAGYAICQAIRGAV